jgi:hypothetical protein
MFQMERHRAAVEEQKRIMKESSLGRKRAQGSRMETVREAESRMGRQLARSHHEREAANRAAAAAANSSDVGGPALIQQVCKITDKAPIPRSGTARKTRQVKKLPAPTRYAENIDSTLWRPLPACFTPLAHHQGTSIVRHVQHRETRTLTPSRKKKPAR